MPLEFETVEEFSVDSEVADATVKVRLRRQTNHNPTRYSRGPYWLDLQVGSYCVDEHFAREAASRFLLEHIGGIAPTRH